MGVGKWYPLVSYNHIFWGSLERVLVTRPRRVSFNNPLPCFERPQSGVFPFNPANLFSNNKKI